MRKFITHNIINPPKIFASPAIKRAGLQSARILADRALYHLRPTRVPEAAGNDVRNLDQDGYCIIRNFLSPQELAAVREEFEHAYADGSDVRQRKVGPCMLGEIEVLQSRSDYPAARLILNSPRLRSIIRAASHREIRLPPVCLLQRFSEDAGEHTSNAILHNEGDFDVENILHQDHCLPVFKAWFYLWDVTDDEGAFVYAPGSHRASAARLAYEYRKSLHVPRMAAGAAIPSSNIDRGRYVPSSEDRAALGLREQSMAGPANSLVIANTCGFHKRGTLKPGHVRKVIHVDFRRMQSRLNSIPFIQRFSGLERAIRQNRRQERLIVD